MHQTLFEKLSVSTFLLQFYSYLARGFFNNEKRNEISGLINTNIARLNLMKDDMNWDGRYDLAVSLLFQTELFLTDSKNKLKYKQICEDIEIVNYLKDNSNDFFRFGIQLKDLGSVNLRVTCYFCPQKI